MSKKMTAVEWLAEKIQEQIDIFCPGGILDDNMINQAKAMEKEQIKDAWLNSLTKGDFNSAEEYYNKTFKSE